LGGHLYKTLICSPTPERSLLSIVVNSGSAVAFIYMGWFLMEYRERELVKKATEIPADESGEAAKSEKEKQR
jgi:hypothetical protein